MKFIVIIACACILGAVIMGVGVCIGVKVANESSPYEIFPKRELPIKADQKINGQA